MNAVYRRCSKNSARVLFVSMRVHSWPMYQANSSGTAAGRFLGHECTRMDTNESQRRNRAFDIAWPRRTMNPIFSCPEEPAIRGSSAITLGDGACLAKLV